MKFYFTENEKTAAIASCKCHLSHGFVLTGSLFLQSDSNKMQMKDK